MLTIAPHRLILPILVTVNACITFALITQLSHIRTLELKGQTDTLSHASLQFCPKTEPNSADVAKSLELADLLLFSDPDHALRIYSDLNRNTQGPSLTLRLAMCHELLNNTDQAVDLYQHVIKTSPDPLQLEIAHFRCGLILLKANQIASLHYFSFLLEQPNSPFYSIALLLACYTLAHITEQHDGQVVVTPTPTEEDASRRAFLDQFTVPTISSPIILSRPLTASIFCLPDTVNFLEPFSFLPSHLSEHRIWNHPPSSTVTGSPFTRQQQCNPFLQLALPQPSHTVLPSNRQHYLGRHLSRDRTTQLLLHFLSLGHQKPLASLAYLLLGNLHHSNLPHAIYWYERAASSGSPLSLRIPATYNLAQCHYLRGHPQLAYRFYLATAESPPCTALAPIAYLNAALIADQLGDYQTAILLAHRCRSMKSTATLRDLSTVLLLSATLAHYQQIPESLKTRVLSESPMECHLSGFVNFLLVWSKHLTSKSRSTTEKTLQDLLKALTALPKQFPPGIPNSYISHIGTAKAHIGLVSD